MAGRGERFVGVFIRQDSRVFKKIWLFLAKDYFVTKSKKKHP